MPNTPATLPYGREAFTVVESLVAIAVVGIAGAALAVSLTAGGVLRRRASVSVAASAVVAGRIALLAARPCAASDTGGTTSAGEASDAWTARRRGTVWVWADSIESVLLAPILLEGAVTCAP